MTDIAPEVTLSSEMVYDGSYISVRKDLVRTGRGATASREIVLHPAVVVMVPIDRDGNLLLVRQYRKAIEQVMLELPAGGIDDGESPEDAVRREMVEETGYEPARVRSMGTIYSSAGMSNEIMHLFLVWDLRGDGVATEPADELQVEVMSRADAKEMVLDGRINDAKSVAGILMLESASLHNDVLSGG